MEAHRDRNLASLQRAHLQEHRPKPASSCFSFPSRERVVEVRPATQPFRSALMPKHPLRNGRPRCLRPLNPFPDYAVTGLGPEQPTTRLYSTNESVMCRRRFRPHTSYPSMGFVPLQGASPSRRVSGKPKHRSRGAFRCSHYASGAGFRTSSLSEFALRPAASYLSSLSRCVGRGRRSTPGDQRGKPL